MIKLIIGNAVPKVGIVVSIHAANYEIQTFKLPNVNTPEQIKKSDSDLPSHCWSMDQLRQAQSISAPLRLIDLRSELEHSARPIIGAEAIIPEAILEHGISDDTTGITLLLVCSKGMISSLLAGAYAVSGLQMFITSKVVILSCDDCLIVLVGASFVKTVEQKPKALRSSQVKPLRICEYFRLLSLRLTLSACGVFGAIELLVG